MKEGEFDRFLEQDIARLSKIVEGNREKPEFRGRNESAVVRESLTSLQEEKEDSGVRPPQKKEEAILPPYLKGMPENAKLQVERLLDTAYHGGIARAMRLSEKRDPAIADAFHDTLVDRLLPILREKGVFPS